MKCEKEEDHKWVWSHRWTFICEFCGLFGEFEDGYVIEDVN